jgi:hypothetical protein
MSKTELFLVVLGYCLLIFTWTNQWLIKDKDQRELVNSKVTSFSMGIFTTLAALYTFNIL